MTRSPSLAPPLAALTLLALAACQPTTGGGVTRGPDAALIPTFTAPAPPESKAGACWAQLPGPTTTELVEQTILVEEAVIAPDGTQTSPAIYRKVTAPQTVSTGDGRWFERVCDADLSADLVMDLQRALAARTYYAGAASGPPPKTKPWGPQLTWRSRRCCKTVWTPAKTRA